MPMYLNLMLQLILVMKRWFKQEMLLAHQWESLLDANQLNRTFFPRLKSLRDALQFLQNLREISLPTIHLITLLTILHTKDHQDPPHHSLAVAENLAF
jgi:hypothetical protein